MGIGDSAGPRSTSSVARSQDPGKGNLVGFVFGRDGSTPVAGAVVVVKNLTTGAVTEAAGSDELGVFKVPGLDAGPLRPRREVRVGELQFPGFLRGHRRKDRQDLDRAEPLRCRSAAAAAAAVIKEQREKGEAFVGKVVKYRPETKEAEVLVEIGLIQTEDRIHVKGQVTDFYQDLTGPEGLRGQGQAGHVRLHGRRPDLQALRRGRLRLHRLQARRPAVLPGAARHRRHRGRGHTRFPRLSRTSRSRPSRSSKGVPSRRSACAHPRAGTLP